MDIEIWKDIPGYEGWYQVSNFGNVRSVDRTIEQLSRHGHMIQRKLKGAMVTPTDNGNGYKIVGLAQNQSRKNHYVHKLVANAFIPNPQGKNEVNHIDYDKGNNRAENLEWVTQTENVMHSVEHMRKPRTKCRPSNTGEKYISFSSGHYRLSMGKLHDRKYKTLEEAKAAREVVMSGGQHYADYRILLHNRANGSP